MQARAVGDELVVGLVPDREILRCKGPPVQNEQERKLMVEAVKWVGEVITGKHYHHGFLFLFVICKKHSKWCRVIVKHACYIAEHAHAI